MSNTTPIPDLAARLDSVVHNAMELHNLPVTLDNGLELTPREMHALQALGERPGLNVSDLGARFRVTKSAASQLVGRLCDRGLALKRRAEDNNKEWRLFLTPLGEQAHAAHAGTHAHGLLELERELAEFSPEELDAAHRVLGRINDLLARRYDRALSSRGQPAPICGHGRGRGPSSFHMQDSDTVFANLQVRPGDVCLDLGSGPGDYALRLAEVVGGQGRVYALDRNASFVERLEREGPGNLRPRCLDITRGLPYGDAAVDLCLMTTVLHILGAGEQGMSVFREVARVLKPGGQLAVIECKKEDQPWGPPKEQRLSPGQVEAMAVACGLERTGLVDLGKTYLLTFRPEAKGGTRVCGSRRSPCPRPPGPNPR
ncbi:MAG: methyltransferase domain-containing protein [Desulfovibrionaceae bacterium]